jgi:hypothetical protein
MVRWGGGGEGGRHRWDGGRVIIKTALASQPGHTQIYINMILIYILSYIPLSLESNPKNIDKTLFMYIQYSTYQCKVLKLGIVQTARATHYTINGFGWFSRHYTKCHNWPPHVLYVWGHKVRKMATKDISKVNHRQAIIFISMVVCFGQFF